MAEGLLSVPFHVDIEVPARLWLGNVKTRALHHLGLLSPIAGFHGLLKKNWKLPIRWRLHKYRID
jgi:hypothetical protein